MLVQCYRNARVHQWRDTEVEVTAGRGSLTWLELIKGGTGSAFMMAVEAHDWNAMKPVVCSLMDFWPRIQQIFHTTLSLCRSGSDTWEFNWRMWDRTKIGRSIMVHYIAKRMWTHNLHACVLFVHPVSERIPFYCYNKRHTSQKAFL